MKAMFLLPFLSERRTRPSLPRSCSFASTGPFRKEVAIVSGFADIPQLRCTIADSHFTARNRMGRLLVFPGRIRDEGTCETVRAIAVDERAAVLLDADGIALVSGVGGAYFVALGQVPGLKRGARRTFRRWT